MSSLLRRILHFAEIVNQWPTILEEQSLAPERSLENLPFPRFAALQQTFRCQVLRLVTVHAGLTRLF